MCLAQQIDPKQDVLKIPVEEVRVQSSHRMTTGDLIRNSQSTICSLERMVVAQNLRGVYRVPAYVLLLADTGGRGQSTKDCAANVRRSSRVHCQPKSRRLSQRDEGE
jgi:uncharacterized protein (DUF1786 family)